MGVGLATYIRSANDMRINGQAAFTAGQVVQLADGRAAFLDRGNASASGDTDLPFQTAGQVTVPANPATGQLDGGRVWWSWANGWADYKRADGRDFYLGRAVGDNLLNALWSVNLNVDPPDDLSLLRDPYTTAPIGTQSLSTGFLPPQRNGGSLTFALASTNEAEKVDALAKDGFDAGGACAVVEAAVNVISVGAGTHPVFTVGVASGTHATNMASVSQYLLCRLDGNATKIQVEAGDGTNTLAETDTTKTFTAGAGNANRFEVWFDLRNPAAVAMYVNGVRVLGSTVINVSAAAARWLPIAHLVKALSTDTFQVDLEWLRVRKAQQRG